MQDKDFINGVIGKYTDRNDERGVTKKNDDLDTAKPTAPKPRKSIKIETKKNLIYLLVAASQAKITYH